MNKDLSKLSLRDLDIKSIVWLLSIISSVATAAFALGVYYCNNKTSLDSDNIKSLYDNFQSKLGKSDYIQIFEKCSESITKKEWDNAFVHYSSNRKEYMARDTASNLKYCYRMTSRYNFNFYIPEVIDKENAVILVDFNYFDYLPLLLNFNKIKNQPIKEVFKQEYYDALKNDIIFELPKCYICPKKFNPDTIVNHYFDDLLIRDILYKKNGIIDEIGRTYKLEPKYYVPLNQDGVQETEKHVLSRIYFIKENGDWKIDKFQTILYQKE